MKDTRKNPGYSAHTPQKLISHLSQEEHGKLQEKLYLFPPASSSRKGPSVNTLTMPEPIFWEISAKYRLPIWRKIHITDEGTIPVTRRGEKLRDGSTREKGVEILMRDASGRIKGKYENGIHDIPPESGHNLKLSIDIELQEYGEQLMRNKIGAIVAIEPSTGEILALVNILPNYDPSLLVGGDRGKNYVSLAVNDIYKPLYDRSIQGTYPPRVSV